MAIKDLEARQGNVNLTVDVVDLGDVREFEKFGKKGRVCNAKVKDATGEVTLTLWNEDIDKVDEDVNYDYVLIAGERRMRAHIMLNRVEIDATLKSDTNEKSFSCGVIGDSS